MLYQYCLLQAYIEYSLLSFGGIFSFGLSDEPASKTKQN